MNEPVSLADSPAESPLDFKVPHSRAIRLWHWTFFLFLLASLVTVLFGSTLFRTRDNIALVQEQLQEKGATVSKDQARAVAHEYSDKLWDLHKWIGFFLCGLLLSRIIIEFAQPGEEKLGGKIRKATGFRPADTLEISNRRHYLLVKRGYLVFYVAIGIMALTGLGLALEDAAWLKDIQRPVKQVHAFVQYFIYAFILLHLAGVIKAELTKHKGIVSGMIHGNIPGK